MNHSQGNSRIWSTAKAGGCARKVSPGILRQIAPWLATERATFMSDAHAVGDAASPLLLSIDLITPLVPSATDFGRIAACNATSDVYVSGAWPINAVAIACVPIGDEDAEMAAALAAARDELRAQGCEVGGGHSIFDTEAKLGFAVIGLPAIRDLTWQARPGDVLLITKPIGVGVVTTAYRTGLAKEDLLAQAISVMVEPNSCVPRLLQTELATALHAATDVTGFGLLGHLYEFCRRSDVGAEVERERIPTIPGASELAGAGACTSAFRANLDYAREAADDSLSTLSDIEAVLFTDPQTSGGALLAVDRDAVSDITYQLRNWNVNAAEIGRITPGSTIRIR